MLLLKYSAEAMQYFATVYSAFAASAFLNVFASGKFPIKQADFFFKNKYLGSVKLKSEKLEQNIQFFIDLSSFNNLEEKEKLEIKIYDKVYNYSEISMFINIISSF